MHALSDLSQQLRDIGLSQPTLIIDAEALDHNIELLNKVLSRGFNHRLVVKSLPCPGLINYIRDRTRCTRLMCFHTPFVLQMLQLYPDADILLGKPLPAAAFEYIIEATAKQSSKGSGSLNNIQWLIDTPERLQAYASIAKKQNINLRINLEIDIGLHRGGFQLNQEYDQALQMIEEADHLGFSGLMGYEAHASKMPSLLGGMSSALKQACSSYQRFKTRAEELTSTDGATFNTGGSTTFNQHHDTALFSELSVGSILLKPCDFDYPHVLDMRPAAYIASPVIKRIDHVDLPGPKILSKLMRAAGQLPPKAAYIYGGNWKAKPVFPESSEQVALFGSSSNQELYGFKQSESLKVDDIMLFRPTQSEAVLLQFGEIALLRDNKIEQWWPVLNHGDNPAKQRD